MDKSWLVLALLSPRCLKSPKDDVQKEKWKVTRCLGLEFLLHRQTTSFVYISQSLCGIILLELPPGHNPLDMAILTQHTGKGKANPRCPKGVKFYCKSWVLARADVMFLLDRSARCPGT